MGEEDGDDYRYAAENETKESDENSNSSTRSASPRQRQNSGAAATGDDAGGNRPDQRRSVFSAERGSSGNPSTDMPEIPIRRRTRVGGHGGVVRGDESNAAGSPPCSDPGTIARASRIITELEQDHGDLEFPLDAMRRDRGFGDDDYGDENLDVT